MKVAKKEAFFSELKKLCRPDMGLIPKRAVIEAFQNVEFNIDKSLINEEKREVKENDWKIAVLAHKASFPYKKWEKLLQSIDFLIKVWYNKHIN